MRKNFAAVEQTLKDLNERSRTQHEALIQLGARLADVLIRLDAAEKTILELRAARVGTGPSVRG